MLTMRGCRDGTGIADDAAARAGLAYCDLAGALAVIIESLAPIPRLPTSDGERKAAHLIRDRFEAAGCSARVEEASGRQLARGPLPRTATTNVVATAGDPGGDKTLVILVHHGAARAVPWANDTLSGVAAAIMVAHALSRQPVSGLRLLLVSAGTEEAPQQGAREFGRRYFPQLDPRRTWFLTIDTVGSGHLVLLEGEGTVRMHDDDESFKDLVTECAEECGVRLLRGLRSRNGTDGCVPLAHDYYHQHSDTPENIDYRSVVGAVRLTEAVIRKLARR